MKANLVFFAVIEVTATFVSIVYTSSDVGTLFAALILHVLYTAFTLIFCYYLLKASERANKAILDFHDFLISYRQTPMSKALRRHLPSLEAVIEE